MCEDIREIKRISIVKIIIKIIALTDWNSNRRYT